MTEQPPFDELLGKDATSGDFAKRRQAYDEAELQEVISNLRAFGDFAHPDDPPGRNLYLQQRYAGTGLIAFLRRIEAKPPRRFPSLD